tara:strand:+ start:370 stop:960 length:591 start_codon:yes stop_codon:yes gene_type:complete
MSTFDYAVILAAFAGLIMVVGGIVLIYKGALVLAATDSNTALSIEWKQDFRLNTQAPGIAFFLIGLIFSSISIYASKPSSVEPITIEGEVVEITEPVTIRARSSTWTLDGGTNGVVKGRIHPHVEDITLEISAPGYKPERITFSLNELKNRTLKFESIELEQQITAIVGSMQNIIPVDASENIQPITATPSFGGAQ